MADWSSSRPATSTAWINTVACQAAFPDLRSEFDGLMARLAKEPVTVDVPSSSIDAEPGRITFTADYFAAVVRHMLKDAKNHSMIPLLIHRAYQDNNWTGITHFIQTPGDYEWWGDQLMEHVIRCSEKWAAFDPEAVNRLSQGSYLRGWELSLSQNQALSCNYTPARETPEGTSAQSGSRVPVLILNGEVDPINPPENMAGAEALWPHSVALVAPYQAHALSNMTVVSCWWSIQNDFIQSGSVEGLDTSCMNNVSTPFFATGK